MNMHDPIREASEAPDHGVVMPPSKQSDTAEYQVRKIGRHQFLDKRSYKADALRCLGPLQRSGPSARSLQSHRIGRAATLQRLHDSNVHLNVCVCAFVSS
jgi:hypothetical protein